MFLPEQWPSYYSRAKGVEVWDLDGNKYVDMSYMGIGACILGYADPDVDVAVHAAIDAGSMTTLNCPEEVELAELLCELHPWASMVRYARGGGEAMAVAVRVDLALAPNTHRYQPGFVGRVLRFAIPAGTMVAASALAAYVLARVNGLPLVQQRTAAALVTLALSLCVLALLAIPLTWRRVMLLVAAVAGFALLFPVSAVRSFYALELPRAGLGFTLLIAALGVAALAGFWGLSRSSSRRVRD